MSNRPITCLLIDDDADDQEIFSLALSDLDKNVNLITSDNCSDALEKLKNKTVVPDCIFLDLNMPGLDGRECLGELKKIAHLNRVPVNIYTTSSSKYDKEKMIQLGASAFITKPSNISVLTKTIYKCIVACEQRSN